MSLGIPYSTIASKVSTTSLLVISSSTSRSGIGGMRLRVLSSCAKCCKIALAVHYDDEIQINSENCSVAIATAVRQIITRRDRTGQCSYGMLTLVTSDEALTTCSNFSSKRDLSRSVRLRPAHRDMIRSRSRDVLTPDEVDVLTDSGICITPVSPSLSKIMRSRCRGVPSYITIPDLSD